jgi:hypothetical protein
MALLKGILAAQMSGSLGGNVFSHNRAGSYVRTRAIPVNPSTEFQQAVRNGMTITSTRWNDTLTEAQRAAWDVYALNVPLTNRVGDPINVGGLGMYGRGNIPRIQVGVGSLPLVDDGPTTFNLGSFTAPVGDPLNESTQALSFAFDNTDEWANEDNAAMLVGLSRPVSPSINFFKGPYRLSATIAGDSVTPPTSPAAVPVPFPVVTGQKVFWTARVSRADGRLSGTFRGTIVVVA